MILVTGAAGHLGSALVRELLADGQRVRALILPGEDRSGLDGLDLEIVEGNVLEPGTFGPFFKDVDFVYHLAAIISIMPGRDDQMRQVNVVGTLNVARAARLAGVRRMVYVSSIHALARPPRGTPICESVRFDPHNAAGEYDQTKAEGSLAVLEQVQKGLDAVIVCPTGIVGPYDFRGGSSMGRQIRQWIKPGSHVVFTGHFDFIDVRDVARGMILACQKGRKGEAYILSGERVSVREIVSIVQRESGHREALFQVPFWTAILASYGAVLHAKLWGGKVQFTRYALETLASNSLVSNQKARTELGYSPRPLKESLGDTVRWMQQNPDPSAEADRDALRAAKAGMKNGKAAPRRRERVAVVTGATGGIGTEVSCSLARLGYRVVLVARAPDRLESLSRRIAEQGGCAEVLAADLSLPGGCAAVYERVMEIGSGIDVLVNNAGFGWYGYASDMSVETARQMVQVNNEALTALAVYFLPVMRARGYGRIINVSSVVGGLPSPWVAVYSATKAFIDSLTTALNRELQGTGVCVSAVRPGAVATEFYKTVSRISEGRSIPVQRYAVKPQMVADAIVKLIRKPRSAVYVPQGLGIVPWIEIGFGWVFDRFASSFLRKLGAMS